MRSGFIAFYTDKSDTPCQVHIFALGWLRIQLESGCLTKKSVIIMVPIQPESVATPT